MSEKWFEVLPELNLIKDEGLRRKVLDVYEEAVKMGGWRIEDLEKIPFTLLIKDCEISYLDHVRSVTQISYNAATTFMEMYGDKAELNLDYLVAGALLHDVGKILEFEKKGEKYVKSKSGKNLRHPFSGVGLAFSKSLPDEVMHMIAVHAHEGDGGKRSPEAIIIHHADFITFEILKS